MRTNQKERLEKRGGRRESKGTWVTEVAHYTPINTATLEPSRAKNAQGEYIIEQTAEVLRVLRRNKRGRGQKNWTIAITPVQVVVSYKPKQIAYTRRVRVG